MNTEIIKISSDNPDKKIIKKAAEVLKKGNLVAFPTETIYGLGANALDEKAVEKIFIAKARPQDNPLIVHIYRINDLKKYVKDISEKAQKLIKKFWPGPLTIVFEKNQIISDMVTCGLNSVAIRMPSNKIALELIKESGVPIAAPSANSSGKPSPAKAEHVFEDLNGKIPLIIDGGDADIGLESSVLSLVNPDKPILLRPGKISREDIEKLIGKIEIHQGIREKLKETEKVESPGLKYRHYCPKAKVILVTGKNSAKKINELTNKYQDQGKRIEIIANYPKEELAKRLFSKFRECDSNKIDIILVSGIDESGIGLAIMDRLRRASSEIIET